MHLFWSFFVVEIIAGVIFFFVVVANVKFYPFCTKIFCGVGGGCAVFCGSCGGGYCVSAGGDGWGRWGRERRLGCKVFLYPVGRRDWGDQLISIPFVSV